MTLKEYKDLAMRTNDEFNSLRLRDALFASMVDVGGVVNASLGLSGEVGELNDMIKKSIFHGHELDFEEVKKEIGDCLWYLALMCNSFRFDLEEIAQMNIDKLIERYPDGFSEYASQNRKEYKHE